LDEYVARLRAFASYVDSFSGDALEFEKALRIVEKRRGDLLGEPQPGRRPPPSLAEVDESEGSRQRWRKIARGWDTVWPMLRDATNRQAVTQAAVLRLLEMGVHYSSETDDWATPQALFDELAAEFAFTLDVCATAENAKCERFFTVEDDGLAQDWAGVCWMNPPYGDAIVRWVEKAYETGRAGATVVCLVPARVDTGWWWDYCRHGEVRFLRGRLKFGGGANSAPFPSAVVVFGRPANIFEAHWERAA
jgi:phage N-6-adenine-methyltransferase